MSHPLRWYQLQLSKIQVEFLILVYSVLVLTLGFQFKAVHKATNIFQASLALVFFWLLQYILMAEKHAQREFVYIIVIHLLSTDTRTDIWSRDFIIWKINSGLWSGLNCEIKGSGPIMSKFWGPFFHFFGVKKN